MTWEMPRRLIMPVLVLLTSLSTLSANEPVHGENPRFLFQTGSPPWRGERIPLPPGFARDLGWNGVEEIRFAPGMFEPAQPDFFSYILVFALEPASDITKKGLERELLTYYRGLSKSVMASARRDVDTDSFTISLEPVEPEHEGAPDTAPKAAAWMGTLDWIEPFATRREQTLYFEVHTWKQGGRVVVLSCVSPVDRQSGAAIWKNLRAIRKTFRLE